MLLMSIPTIAGTAKEHTSLSTGAVVIRIYFSLRWSIARGKPYLRAIARLAASAR